MRKTLIIILGATLTVSCVSKKKHMALGEEKRIIGERHHSLQKETNNFRDYVKKLIEENDKLHNDNSKLFKELNDCANRNNEKEIIKMDYPTEGEIFTVVEKMPQFPGGEEELYSYLGKNIRYPDSAKNNGIKGKVYVQFVIETNGSITNIKTARGIGYGCNTESERVVSMMPNWTPGEQRGEKVRVKYTLPIFFQLR